MEDRSHALAAGLFAIVLGAAAVFAVWWFSGTREDMTEYVLVSTGNVSGLTPQAAVRFRGMAAGKVNTIRIDPQDARKLLVSISVREDLPITKETTATLGYQGVTGLAYVQLEDPGTSTERLVSDDGTPPRLPLEPGLLDQLADTALDTAQRFREISRQAAGFFDDENVERFKAALQTLESASSGVDRTFREAPETLVAIRAFFSDENLAKLSDTLAHLERTSGESTPLIAEMRSLTTRAENVLGTIDGVAATAGDSLLDGTLPQLNKLLQELTDTSARMGRLIEEVEASPQVLITGRGDRRPGPGEPGFQQRER